MAQTNQFLCVKLRGSDPFARGVQYGQQAEALIRRAIEGYHRQFQKSVGQSWDAVVKRSHYYTDFVNEHYPEEFQEMLGIAEGSGVAVDEIMALNCRYEILKLKLQECTTGAILKEASGGKVYLLQDHLDRFFTSAKALDINIPMSKAELGRLLTDLLAKVDGTTHFVYWQVTRGVETRNHVYAEDLPGKLWVSIRQNHLNDPDVPIKLNTEEDTRFYHCNIKTLNLLPSVAAAQHAKRIGVQETVFHRGDIVTECAHSNVSILKDGVFYSHPNDEFILRGIAKTHMIQACYRLGITVMEKCFTLDDLKNADEIIVTSSSNFCLHACEVDGKPAGGKDPATLKAIQSEVLREYYAYTGKTTVVD